ncbi:MAG: DNA repair protein RecN [Burkholderiales bacterium]|nr:DNA repair protein RecN [Burkholderiales bacterium]
MLLRLGIQDFVIVERMEIEFGPGFTVFTGETGAGKSILVDALALALGERGDASIVRQGAGRAEIEAEFSVSPGFCGWLRENDLEGDEGSCLLRRIVDASGRSRSYVNGRSVTLQQLREAAEFLVDIHGQHAHQSLLKGARQQEMLDVLAGAERLASDVSTAYRQWSSLRKARRQFEENRAEIDAQRETLTWQVNELSHLAFDLPEWEETLHEQGRLAHAASLMEGARYALDALSEADDSCLSRLGSVDSRLASLEGYDAEISQIRPLIDSAHIQVAEAVHSLRHYVDRLDLDPGRLQALEARIDAVHSASRKYRVPPQELPSLLEKAKSRLSELNEAGDIDALLEKEGDARKIYEDLALKLSASRREMAARLSVEVTDSMRQLSMTGGTFEVSLEALPEGDAHGMEKVEFLVAANPGTPLKPLAKVASGGELSRISLAIQVMGLRAQRVPTLIFDEVDVGIGGGVAEIVGRLLFRLGKGRQVLCVTHLPQVASCADSQFSVSKESGRSRIRHLDEEGRVEEIARMLGGVEITETTRDHAREMLGKP